MNAVWADPTVVSRQAMSEIDALCAEVGSKNRVRVTKWAITRPSPFARSIRRRLDDDQYPSVLTRAGLMRLDELRIMSSQQPKWVAEAYRICGGDLRSVTANLRTNAGIDYVSAALGDPASPTTTNPTDYMALSTSATAPAATHTTLAGATGNELGSGVGLARAVATYAHTGGNTFFTLVHTYTASGAGATAVQLEGIFVGAAATATADTGTLFLENTFTSTNLVAGDQLTVTHTCNV